MLCTAILLVGALLLGLLLASWKAEPGVDEHEPLLTGAERTRSASCSGSGCEDGFGGPPSDAQPAIQVDEVPAPVRHRSSVTSIQ